MNPSLRELGTPAKLIGFAVVLAAVFALAFVSGGRFGPDLAPAAAAMTGRGAATDQADSAGHTDSRQTTQNEHADQPAGTPPTA